MKEGITKEISAFKNLADLVLIDRLLEWLVGKFGGLLYTEFRAEPNESKILPRTIRKESQ